MESLDEKDLGIACEWAALWPSLSSRNAKHTVATFRTSWRHPRFEAALVRLGTMGMGPVAVGAPEIPGHRALAKSAEAALCAGFGRSRFSNPLAPDRALLHFADITAAVDFARTGCAETYSLIQTIAQTAPVPFAVLVGAARAPGMVGGTPSRTTEADIPTTSCWARWLRLPRDRLKAWRFGIGSLILGAALFVVVSCIAGILFFAPELLHP